MIRVMSAAHRVGAEGAAFLFCEYHIVRVHGMVWHFVGIDKMFSCKGLLYDCYFTFRGNSRFYLTNKVK